MTKLTGELADCSPAICIHYGLQQVHIHLHWLAGVGLLALPCHHSVNNQKKNGANDRCNETGALPFGIPSQKTPQEARDNGSCNSQQYRDENPARILAGHQKLCNSSRE
jgi:hypothetical protein